MGADKLARPQKIAASRAATGADPRAMASGDTAGARPATTPRTVSSETFSKRVKPRPARSTVAICDLKLNKASWCEPYLKLIK